MTAITESQHQSKQILFKDKGGLSMSQQMLIALVLGIATGLFLGKYANRMKFFADIYIGLLQMMVLSYIILWCSIWCLCGQPGEHVEHRDRMR